LLRSLGYARAGATAKPDQPFGLDWRTAWAARRIYGSVFHQLRRAPQLVPQAQALADETIALLTGPNEAITTSTRLKQVRQQALLYSRLAAADLCLGLGIAVLTGLTSRLLKTPLAAANALAAQGVCFWEDELNQALLLLSRLAAADAPFRAGLLETDNLEAYFQVAPAEIKRALAELLERHGRQAVYEADPACPRYAEDPTPLLEIIRRCVKTEAWSHAPSPAPAGPGQGEPPTGFNRFVPWRTWLAGLLLRRLRRFLLLRDQLHRLKAEALAACRRWALATGHKWAEQGWLDRPDDIFWLSPEEIERVFRVEAGLAPTLSSTVRARQATYQTYAETKLPFTLADSEIASIQLGVGLLGDSSAVDVVVGLPVSPGQARGTVVVVHRPDEFEKLAGEMILVMPSTDPAWLALLPAAAGLIVETGGLLSHGSVIAREYGLPAVANIPQATDRFHTGDKVLVDGSTGVIQVLERNPQP
jgi:pyruvate,water dikinase